jgi:hypothetical protein
MVVKMVGSIFIFSNVYKIINNNNKFYIIMVMNTIKINDDAMPAIKRL